MAADGIGRDCQHRPAEIGHQSGAQAQINVALLANGVRGRIVLGGIVGIEEQRVDRLIAFEVDDAERRALAHHIDPIRSRRHDLAVAR